jgi:hypothetical protein
MRHERADGRGEQWPLNENVRRFGTGGSRVTVTVKRKRHAIEAQCRIFEGDEPCRKQRGRMQSSMLWWLPPLSVRRPRSTRSPALSYRTAFSLRSVYPDKHSPHPQPSCMKCRYMVACVRKFRRHRHRESWGDRSLVSQLSYLSQIPGFKESHLPF